MSDDQDPSAVFWCRTHNEPATFRCRELHHDVRPLAGGGIIRDPSVEQWASAVELSTGARLRQALEANEALARDLEIAIRAKRLATKQWAVDVDALIGARQETEQLAETNERLNQEIRRLEAELGSALGALNKNRKSS